MTDKKDKSNESHESNELNEQHIYSVPEQLRLMLDGLRRGQQHTQQISEEDSHVQYHTQYGHIKNEVVRDVRSFIKSGFFKKDEDEKFEMLKLLHKALCEHYSIPIIPLLHQDNLSNNGCFSSFPIPQIVIYGKSSLVTYLHEFKHYLNFAQHKPDSENMARGWSLSLFYLATPRLFEKAVKKGLIIHQKEFIKPTIPSDTPQPQLTPPSNNNPTESQSSPSTSATPISADDGEVKDIPKKLNMWYG